MHGNTQPNWQPHVYSTQVREAEAHTIAGTINTPNQPQAQVQVDSNATLGTTALGTFNALNPATFGFARFVYDSDFNNPENTEQSLPHQLFWI